MSLSGFRLLRADEPIHVGLVVVTLRGEIDGDDEQEEDRVTPPLSVGRISSNNHRDVWNLVFDFNGAWVCPSEAELRNSTQYTLYVKDI